jgi:hypothetical protein
VLLLALLAACGAPDAEPMTWNGGVSDIFRERCESCHADGEVAPFALSTYDEVVSLGSAVENAIATGSMPPWMPSDDCNSYQGDFSLPDEERDALLEWLAAGAPEGEDPGSVTVTQQSQLVNHDVIVGLEAPYTPVLSPDEYRCFVAEWPEGDDAWMTGFEVFPDATSMVHHVIVYKAGPEEAELYRELDAADPEPGYSCFGGPNGDTGGGGTASQLASWVPGATGTSLPEGVGLLLEAGSVIVLQMHYNLGADGAVPDQTTVGFELAPEVERPGVVQIVTDIGWMGEGGMPIPAGEAEVTHRSDIDLTLFRSLLGMNDALGVDADSPLEIHSAALHLHELGVSGRSAILREDGTEACLLEIPEWDFAWQGSYRLAQPEQIGPDDLLSLSCTWDNSAANQPLVDGVQAEPIDVQWGEGTRDEMCLTGMLFTAPE